MRIFIAVIVVIIACLQTLAFAAETASDGTVVAEEAGAVWSAEISWENAVAWQSHKETGRSYAFDLRAVPEWRTGNFTLGSELVLHGERNTADQGFVPDNTLLYARYAALEGRGLTMGPKVTATAPTNQIDRRDQGFLGSAGGGIFAILEHELGTVEWETNGTRVSRRSVNEETDPTLSRWELYHELVASFGLGKGFAVAQRFRWTRAWMKARNMADTMVSEQLLGYEFANYRVEAGHLFERELRAVTGEKKRISLSSAGESQLVGNLILKL